MSEWISVKDSLPGMNCRVIVATKRHGVQIGAYHLSTAHYKNPCVVVNCLSMDLTHWMPLPATPKE